MSKQRNIKAARARIARYICERVCGINWDKCSAKAHYLRHADDIAGILQEEIKAALVRAGERN